jgi:inosine-uridine nucleoside N-ribohydrolase
LRAARVARAETVIIDCDPGVDDALALILALRSPELNVRAVTTVCGNAGVDQTYANASFLIDLIALGVRPVLAKGAQRPLRKEFSDATHVHGADGLGGLDRFTRCDGSPKYPRRSPPKSVAGACELVRSIVESEPGGVTLIATGPLTNVATLASEYPDVLKRLRSLIVMGGSYDGTGNVTPHAEFNFWVDPDAAQIVLSAGIPTTCIGLDITTQVRLLSADIESHIKPLATHLSEFICDATAHTVEFHKARHGFGGLHIHDAVAVAYAIDSSLFGTTTLAVAVECEDPSFVGAVRIVPDQPPNVSFATSIDARGFLELFFERLRGVQARQGDLRGTSQRHL